MRVAGTHRQGLSRSRQSARRLGLPQKILQDDDGREHRFYEGASRLVGLGIGTGIAGPPGAIPSLINTAQVNNGAEYVFNSDNVLVAKFEASKDHK